MLELVLWQEMNGVLEESYEDVLSHSIHNIKNMISEYIHEYALLA